MIKYCLLFILILSACISQETKVNSHQSNIHYNLALELAQNALYQNSLDEFAKAISLDPGNINAYRKKGLVYFGLRQYDEAEKLFVKAISLDPHNVQSHINLGMVKYYKGDKAEAKNLWQKSVNFKSDDNVFLVCFLGKLLLFIITFICPVLLLCILYSFKYKSLILRDGDCACNILSVLTISPLKPFFEHSIL